MTENKLFSCEYELDGYTYALHLYGSLEEVTHHAEALGLSEPEELLEIIPVQDWRH